MKNTSRQRTHKHTPASSQLEKDLRDLRAAQQRMNRILHNICIRVYEHMTHPEDLAAAIHGSRRGVTDDECLIIAKRIIHLSNDEIAMHDLDRHRSPIAKRATIKRAAL